MFKKILTIFCFVAATFIAVAQPPSREDLEEQRAELKLEVRWVSRQIDRLTDGRPVTPEVVRLTAKTLEWAAKMVRELYGEDEDETE